MISAIAIDDEPLALNIIEQFCSMNESVVLKHSFLNPTEAIKHIETHTTDLLFCDIQMPDINGITLCKNLSKKPLIIFTTAYEEYAVQGFELNAIDYLLKPISLDRFNISIQRAVEYTKFLEQKTLESNKIYVRSEYQLISILKNDIEYIEGMDDYIKIYCVNKRPIISKITMKLFLEQLSNDDFIRIHRSYIVNLKYINAIAGNNLSINEKNIPIGAVYKSELLSKIK